MTVVKLLMWLEEPLRLKQVSQRLLLLNLSVMMVPAEKNKVELQSVVENVIFGGADPSLPQSNVGHFCSDWGLR